MGNSNTLSGFTDPGRYRITVIDPHGNIGEVERKLASLGDAHRLAERWHTQGVGTVASIMRIGN